MHTQLPTASPATAHGCELYASRMIVGISWEASRRHLGGSLEASREPRGGLLGASWGPACGLGGHLGAKDSPPGASGALLGPRVPILVRSRGPPRAVLGALEDRSAEHAQPMQQLINLFPPAPSLLS